MSQLSVVPQEVVFTIENGPLGLNATDPSKNATTSLFFTAAPVYKFQFNYFVGTGGNAERLAGHQLQPGMVLKSVNGRELLGMPYAEVIDLLAPRPANLVFVETGDSTHTE
jgi:hypothetical protein